MLSPPRNNVPRFGFFEVDDDYDSPPPPPPPTPPPPPPNSPNSNENNSDKSIIDELLSKIQRQARRIAALEQERDEEKLCSNSSINNGMVEDSSVLLETRASSERTFEALRGRVHAQARELDELRRKLAMTMRDGLGKNNNNNVNTMSAEAAYIMELEDGIPDAPKRELARLRAELRHANEDRARLSRGMKSTKTTLEELCSHANEAIEALGGTAEKRMVDVGSVLSTVVRGHLSSVQAQADRRETLLLKTKRMLDKALEQQRHHQQNTENIHPNEKETTGKNSDSIHELEARMRRVIIGPSDALEGETIISFGDRVDIVALMHAIDTFPGKSNELKETRRVLSLLASSLSSASETRKEMELEINDAVHLAGDYFSMASDRLGVPMFQRRSPPTQLVDAVQVLGRLVLELLSEDVIT